MALLFQSNPDQWDLRRSLSPEGYVSWFVTRYQNFMRPWVLTLLWEAQGKTTPPDVPVRGLYGWGITTKDPVYDSEGRLRIRLQYVERWVSNFDVQNETPKEKHRAAIPAADVLALDSWSDHLLAQMPAGTNFIVTPEQLDDLAQSIVGKRFPESQFSRAVRLDLTGAPLRPESFEFRTVKEVSDG